MKTATARVWVVSVISTWILCAAPSSAHARLDGPPVTNKKGPGSGADDGDKPSHGPHGKKVGGKRPDKSDEDSTPPGEQGKGKSGPPDHAGKPGVPPHAADRPQDPHGNGRPPGSPPGHVDGDHGPGHDHGSRGPGPRPPRVNAETAAKVAQEMHKHLARMAKIDRLDQLAEEHTNDKLKAKVALLREKEMRRHQRVMARLHDRPDPGAKQPPAAEADPDHGTDAPAEPQKEGVK